MARLAFITVISFSLAGAIGYFVYHELTSTQLCEFCHRPFRPAMYCEITLEDGSSEKTCCPRCVLQFQKGRSDVASVEAADFDTGKRIDAAKAYYVENSDVQLCCSNKRVERDRMGTLYMLVWDRCLPSLVAFEDLAGAEAFLRDHSGQIRTYAELLEESL